MSTFYQALMPGTTLDEANALLDKAWKIDNSAHIRTTHTLVYRDPRVMEVINAGTIATPGFSESPGGGTEDDIAPVDPASYPEGSAGRLFDVQDDRDSS